MGTTGTDTEKAGHPHRPLTPAEHLAAIFAGELTADGGEIAALAKSVLDERNEMAARLNELGDQAVERFTEDLWQKARLRSMEIRGGNWEMDITEAGELAALYVGMARALLGDAENYTETPFGFPKAKVEHTVKVAEQFEWFVLTVQRKGKITPHEARRRAETERDELASQVERLSQTIAALPDATANAAANLAHARAERDRLHATLTFVQMIATEATADDAGLLRQAILEHLGPDTAKAGA